MTLTYDESANLMKDVSFIGRVKVSCLTYANYIYGEASTVPGHSSRIRWAQNVTGNADFVATQTTSLVVMDSAVQTDGSAITDANLQSAVENAVNKTL